MVGILPDIVFPPVEGVLVKVGPGIGCEGVLGGVGVVNQPCHILELCVEV